MKVRNIVSSIFFLLVVAGTVHAASFSCSKATSEVEKIICGDGELSRLDESLNKAYLKALKRADTKGQTIESQRQWLKNERNACRDAECIRKAYETQIKELGSLSSFDIEALAPPNGSASSPEAPPRKSKPRVAKSPAEVDQTKTGRQHESGQERLRKSEAGLPMNEQLLLAAGNGSLEQVRTLLDKGADLNATDEDGHTILMYAGGSENPEVVKFLVNKHLDVNAKTKTGSTALMDAVRSGNLEIVKILIDKGADINAKDASGFTALMGAAYRGDLGQVDTLLGKGADLNAKGGVEGATALMWAAKSSKVDKANVAKLLVEKGADVNAKNKYGRTALMDAAHHESLDVVKFFVDKGAHVNVGDQNGRTALMTAASRGYLGIAKLLIENGADVSARDRHGYTALMDAAWQGRVETVEFLIDKGADVNAKALNGETVLMKAVMPCGNCSKDRELIRLLINKGADVHAKAMNGDTALKMALEADAGEMVALLKAHGAKE